MHALRELGRNTLVIIATTLGLIAIAAFFEVAVEISTAWWEWIIGLTIATVVAFFALGIILVAISSSVGMTAVGWLGIFAGRVPPGFGRGANNLQRAIGNLALFGGAVYLGRRLYLHGDAEGELNWALEGLFLMGAGVLFGLLAAVPRLYFATKRGWGEVIRLDGLRPESSRRAARRQRARDEGRDKDELPEAAENIAVLITLAMLGVGLSMAVVNSTFMLRTRDGRATLPYNDWLEGCIDRDRDLPECSVDAIFSFTARRADRLRVEVSGQCPATLRDTAGEGIATLDETEKKALGIPPSERGERTRWVFDPAPGTEYRVHLEPGGDGACFYSVRYLEEPTGNPVAKEERR